MQRGGEALCPYEVSAPQKANSTALYTPNGEWFPLNSTNYRIPKYEEAIVAECQWFPFVPWTKTEMPLPSLNQTEEDEEVGGRMQSLPSLNQTEEDEEVVQKMLVIVVMSGICCPTFSSVPRGRGATIHPLVLKCSKTHKGS